MRLRGQLILLVLLGLLLWSPPSALAGEAKVEGGVLKYIADGETNTVSVGFSLVLFPPPPSSYTITDSTATVTVGAGCTSIDEHSARCNDTGIGSISAILSSGTDSISFGILINVPAVVDGGTGSDALTGTEQNDTLVGGPPSAPCVPTPPFGCLPSPIPPSDGDVLNGAGGNDNLDGGYQSDTLDGGPGRDILVGGSDGDTATYFGRGAGVTVSLDGLANDGNAEDENADNVQTESVRGTDSADSLTGGSGRDQLRGEGGGDVLSGLGEDDTLIGGPGADDLIGGDGFDTTSYGERSLAVQVTLGAGSDDGNADDFNGTRRDNAQTEEVVGGTGGDTLTGDAGPNTLEGGIGDDVLDGGPGPDSFAGGAGTDTISYAARSEGVTVSVGGEADDGSALDDDGTSRDWVSNAEIVEGGAGADAIDGRGYAGWILKGNGGNDSLFVGSHEECDFFDNCSQVGSPGELFGGAGDDDLTGSLSTDTLHGGSGADSLRGDVGGDMLIGDDDLDTADYAGYGFALTVTLDGLANDGPASEGDNVQTENVTGGNLGDTITGDGLANVLLGEAGDDILTGAGGNDELVGGDGDDDFDAGAGQDRVNSRDGIEEDPVCGLDVDTAVVDALDHPNVDCEVVEAPPVISVSDPVVGEGDDLVFTVSLADTDPELVSVDYATAAGTATEGSDYLAESGTLTIPGGETSATVTVDTSEDAVDENDETVLLNLSAPENGVLGDSQGIGTLADDDPPPTISIGGSRVLEGNSRTKKARFVVRLSAPSERQITVHYATRNGSAAAPGDYYRRSGNLVFAPGQVSKTIVVRVRGDRRDEPNEAYYVRLSAPVNVTMLRKQGRGRIIDND